jgi:hypothetical protein
MLPENQSQPVRFICNLPFLVPPSDAESDRGTVAIFAWFVPFHLVDIDCVQLAQVGPMRSSRDASVTLTGMCPYAGAKAMTDELHYFAVVRSPPL